MSRAEELYQKLLESEIIGQKGTINFNLGSISVKIQDVNVVGNILQEWLASFMSGNNFMFAEKPNSQEFPDYLLSSNASTKEDLLEVKAFKGSPNFDVANFSAYARSLRDHAYRLDAKYLIFKYSANDGEIIIENIWLKNVWEICSPSNRSPVKIQWKQGDPVNIRPATWYSDKTAYQTFSTRKDFVHALSQVIGMARIETSIQRGWLAQVEQNYSLHTNNQI